MKIAFVYDAIYPWVKGGAEMRNYELGKRLSAKGHEIHIFGVKWWEGEDSIEYEKMTLHGVCKARDLYVNGRRSISEALIFAVKLFPSLMREKFDLIDVSVFPYFSCFTVKVVSLLRMTPSVFTWHEVWGDYWYEYMGKIGFFGKITEKAVSMISKKNIAVSDWTKQRLEALGVPGKDIKVVPNGIDLSRISQVEPERGLTSFGNRKPHVTGSDIKIYDVIFAGRLIKEKNVDVLLKVVSLLKAEYPDIKCCIVGDGPEMSALLALAKKLEICESVDFTGFQEYLSLIGKIKASKVLVLPSSREGFGMVVIEAFACGVPVVTVMEKYNAAQGLVEDEVDGFVVELDANAVEACIKKVIQVDFNCKDMSEKVICKAKNFDWNEIVVNLLGAYHDLISDPYLN